MFGWWRQRKAKRPVRCPWCWEQVPYGETVPVQCSVAGNGHGTGTHEWPTTWADILQGAPEMLVPIIGWRDVGKTELLKSLPPQFAHLDKVVKEFSHRPLTQAAWEAVNPSGPTLADTTPRVLPPWVFMLEKFSNWKSRTLVFRDIPGEIFESLDLKQDHSDVPLVRRLLSLTHTCMFVFSIPDLMSQREADRNQGDDPRKLRKTKEPRSLSQLMHTFLACLDTAGVPHRAKERRAVIVVFSKADRMRQYSKWPLLDRLLQEVEQDELIEALRDKPGQPWPWKRFEEYIDRMRMRSDMIEKWVCDDLEERQFVNQAKNSGIQLTFCLTSAGTTVHSDDGQHSLLSPDPRRTIDPLLWALEINSGRR